MPDDPDKPVVSLEVTAADADTLKAALEEEGIEVGDISERPAAGFGGLLTWLLLMVLSGAAWDISKFVTKRGAKGLRRLVGHLKKKSGQPDADGVVVLKDAKKTTLTLASNLPEAAYKALETLDWSKFSGKDLRWHDPPGEWRGDDPVKITGD